MLSVTEELAFFVVREGFGDNLITQVGKDSRVVGGIVTHNNANHLVIQGIIGWMT